MKKSKIFSTILSLAIMFALVMPVAILFAGCNQQNTKGRLIYLLEGLEAKSVEYDNGTTLSQEQVYDNWKETRPGYVFDGWYFDSARTRKVEGNVTINGDVRLYATSSLGRFTLSFDTNGGTEIAPISKNYGSEIEAVDNPTRTGYDFVRWNPSIPATMPDHNITVVAEWQVHSHSLTFIWGDGDDERAVINLNYGEAVVAPTPTKTGYTLVDWGEEVPETMPDEDIFYYANWQINRHTITFDSNGGSPVDSITEDYGTAISAPESPTRDGYTFAGWFLSDSAYQYQFSTMPDQDLTLVAHWVDHGFTLTFVLNNGEANIVLVQSAGTDFEAPVPTRTGYDFEGWTPDLPTTFPAENMTLAANWKAHQYSIKRTYVDGSDEISTYTIEDVFTLAASTREGHTFDYWVVSSAAGNWVADEHITATTELSGKYGDIEIVAVDHINTHTITFVWGEGNDERIATPLEYGETVIRPADPTKEGYTFAGWDSTIPSIMPDHDVTITATWQIQQHNINIALADKQVENWNEAIAAKIEEYQTILNNPDTPAETKAQTAKLKAILENAAKTFGYAFFANSVDFGDENISTIFNSYAAELSGTAGAIKQAAINAGAIENTYTAFASNTTTAYQVSYNTNISSLYVVFAGMFFKPEKVTISIGEHIVEIPTLEVGTSSQLVRVEKISGFAAVSVIKLNLDISGILDEGRYIHNGDMDIAISWKKLSSTIEYLKGELPNDGEIEGDDFSDRLEFDSGYAFAGSDYGAVGYHVVNWNYNESSYPTGSALSAAQCLEFYLQTPSLVAEWQANQTILSFNANDNDFVDYPATMPTYDVRANYGELLGNLEEVPTRTGFNFLGFFTSNNIKLFNADGTVNKPSTQNEYISETGTWVYFGENNQNLSLYAHWQGATYSITFNANGGLFTNNEELYVADFACGATVVAPTNPSKSGWKFNGWNIPIPDRMPANNLTITALWKSFHVTVKVDEGFEDAGTIVEIDDDILAGNQVELRVLSVNNAFNFAGWFDINLQQLISTEQTYSFEMGFADRNIVAKFVTRPELSNFEFNTTDGFVITGVKDRTVSSIVVPSYVTEIAEGAFKGCPNLVSLDIPFIGKSADQNSFTVEFDGMWFHSFKVTKDEYDAVNSKSTVYMKISFYKTIDDVKVYYYYLLPHTLVNLYLHATYGVDENENPKALTIPNIAFWKDTSTTPKTTLTTIYFDGTIENWIGLSFGAQTANPMFCSTTTNFYLKNNQGEYVSTAGELVIPDGTTKITQNTFLGWTQITKLVLPVGLKTIGQNAFKGCTGLQTIIINETAYSADSHTYAKSVFADCYTDTKINVYFAGTQEQWNAIAGTKIKDETLLDPNKTNVYFYSETEPTAADYTTDEIRFWHYVDNEPVIWTKPTQS